MCSLGPSVLIFTCSEHGQANVNLATSYELALAGVNVCIASFAPLRPRVSHLQDLVSRHASPSSVEPTGSVTFIECKGIDPYWEALNKHGISSSSLAHSHGVSGALDNYSSIDLALCPWNREEYAVGIESIKEIITTIKPNVVVVDFMLCIARDACILLDQNFMVILPNSIKEVALNVQPYAAALWKYPMVSSGFSFPLKWWQIPLNIYLFIRLTLRAMTSVHLKSIEGLRSSFGLGTLFNHTLPAGVTYICPSLIEIDFPFAFIPQQLSLCGPIVMPSDPVEETDPALAKWLDNGPTVMINLGSHLRSNEGLVREMASAIRVLVDYHDRIRSSKIQVLWKSMHEGNVHTMIDEIIGKDIGEGRVKVLSWLEAEPVSILQHPNVVCTVHHGGANSFYEGIWSGIPHIVLPVWLDTYDFATRAEFLHVGLFGNKTCAPGVRAEEFGQALVKVTGDTKEAAEFRTAAARLKGICRAKRNGRELSALTIMKEARKVNSPIA